MVPPGMAATTGGRLIADCRGRSPPATASRPLGREADRVEGGLDFRVGHKVFPEESGALVLDADDELRLCGGPGQRAGPACIFAANARASLTGRFGVGIPQPK